MEENQQSIVLISKSPEKTFSIGELIGKMLAKGDILALTGELGSGKTLFTQGIAKGLKIPNCYKITSPTFNLINEYPSQISLYHMDVYRLSNIDDMEELGFEEYLARDGVVVIEWAEKIKELIPDDAIVVHLSVLSETTRRIEIIIKKKQIICNHKRFS